MPAPRKFDEETRARAVRMYRDRLRDHPEESKLAARRHVGGLLDINAATMRNWIEREDIDAGAGLSVGLCKCVTGVHDVRPGRGGRGT